MTDYAALLAEVREIADKLTRVASYSQLDPRRQAQALYLDADRLKSLLAPFCPPVIGEAAEREAADYLRAAEVAFARAYGGKEPTS